MVEFLMVGIGGFIGSCGRFGLTKLLRLTHTNFPFATLLSNAIAGFAIGFFIGYSKEAGTISERCKLFVTTGLLGGLSTFSTFSLETVELFGQKKYVFATTNIILNLAISLAGVVLGMWLGGKMFAKGGTI
jgi:CrcB protein